MTSVDRADDYAEAAANTDRIPPAPALHLSHLGARMLRLLGLGSHQRSAGDFELLATADADAEATGKGEPSAPAGAPSLRDGSPCICLNAATAAMSA